MVLRYLKHRWLRDVADLLLYDEDPEADLDVLPIDDVDFDKDLIELARVAGPDLLRDLALAVLTAEDRLPLPACLDPELDEETSERFLRLVAVNLAFRLRTDALLAELLRFTAHTPTPRPDPAAVGALLARARSEADARALIEASPLQDEARAAALAAAVAPALDPTGSRLHVRVEDHEALEKALTRAVRPALPTPWSSLSPARRRFVALKPRGGWVTLLVEGDAPEPELAKALGHAGGVSRVCWTRFADEGDGLQVFEGSRVALSDATLTERLGRLVTRDDLLGTLRAFGVLDLDPGHPRGVPPLRFAAAADLDERKHRIRQLAYA